MSENWKLQLSVKIDGVHLLNMRADTPEELSEWLAWAEEHREPILLACAALGSSQKPQQVQPPATPRPALIAPPGATSGQGGEVGPVLVKGTSKTSVTKDGRSMKSPRFTVEFSNGKRLSTFDETIAQAAETLAGQSVYYSTETKGDFTNLSTIRRAVQ